jgi:hypothetical protein
MGDAPLQRGKRLGWTFSMPLKSQMYNNIHSQEEILHSNDTYDYVCYKTTDTLLTHGYFFSIKNLHWATLHEKQKLGQ